MADTTTSTHSRGAELHQSTSAPSASLSPLRIEIEQEDDGRWLADVVSIPGVMAYGATPQKAAKAAKALALHAIADRLEHGEPIPGVVDRLFGQCANLCVDRVTHRVKGLPAVVFPGVFEARRKEFSSSDCSE